MEPVGNNIDVFRSQSGDAVFERVPETGYLLVFRFAVVIIIRFEGFQDTVALVLDGLVGLIDRKVEVGYQRRIHPGLAHVVAELRSAVAWQEPDDDDDACRNECQP